MPQWRVMRSWNGNFVRTQNISTEFRFDQKRMLQNHLIETRQKLLRRTLIQLTISKFIEAIRVLSHSNIKLQLYFLLEAALRPWADRLCGSMTSSPRAASSQKCNWNFIFGWVWAHMRTLEATIGLYKPLTKKCKNFLAAPGSWLCWHKIVNDSDFSRAI